ncbi:MAG: hypothetical protein M3314_08530 [Actinomycetota bacterium]|nr:hypothetical protein [Actinomycetota bacterium]
MSESGTSTSCSACGKPVLPNLRRCAHCGAWLRPWSVGGTPSTRNRYKVGGAGRPEDWGSEIGNPSDAAGSVWERIGPKGDRVRQVGAAAQTASSGAPAGRERVRAPRLPRRARKTKA